MVESTLSFLDDFRLKYGNNNLINYFRNMALYDSRNASVLLNDDNLHYGTLFTLQHEIEQFGLSNHMNLRNKLALILTREIISNENKALKPDCTLSDYIQASYSSLKWMLETGISDDGSSNEYDRVMDVTSSFLIIVYNDRTILPSVAAMIFSRHEKGLLTHDLVWTFFECKDSSCLTLIARYLKSSDPDNANLAKKLLGLGDARDKDEQYEYFIDWVRENGPYLYFSGESFQQSGNPKHFTVMMGGKYLRSAVFPHTGKIIRQLSEKEKKLLSEFNSLEYKLQVLLTDYSEELHNKDKNLWNTWLTLPLEEQIKQAHSGGIS